jgi:hypothetical protein
MEDRNQLGVFYIGLGDQFDDDRRRVREVASALRPVMHPSSAVMPHPVISADSCPPSGGEQGKADAIRAGGLRRLWFEGRR